MKLLLCGGGCGEQTKLTYEKLNQIIDQNRKILYVPLAMDEKDYPYDGCLKWIYEELSIVKHSGIEMVRTFEELANTDYSNYGCIFIGGGNTYKLLKGLKDSESIKKIEQYLNQDGIIVGSSAGSVIFGKDIDIIKPMDPNKVDLKDTLGFNKLNNISIFPHYKNYKLKLTDKENKDRMDVFTNYIIDYSLRTGKVYAIPEEDSIYFDGDKIEILGNFPYYICENGVIAKINT